MLVWFEQVNREEEEVSAGYPLAALEAGKLWPLTPEAIHSRLALGLMRSWMAEEVISQQPSAAGKN